MVCMRRRSAAARYLVCFLAVASLPVLPVLSWTLPGWRVLPAWMDLREPSSGPVSSTRSNPSALPTPSAPSAIPSGIPPGPHRFATAPRAFPEMAPPEQVPSAPVQIAAAPQPPPARARLDGWRAGMLAWLAGVLLALAPVGSWRVQPAPAPAGGAARDSGVVARFVAAIVDTPQFQAARRFVEGSAAADADDLGRAASQSAAARGIAGVAGRAPRRGAPARTGARETV